MDEKSPAEGKPAPPPEAPDAPSRNGLFGSLRFETIGSIMAIVVGVAALFISWDQGKVMREEVRASVWPALQLDGFVSVSGGQMSMGLNIQNAGVGPALIKTIQLRHRGVLVRDLDELAALFPDGAGRSSSTLSGRILAAGDVVRPFEFRFPVEGNPDAVAVMAEVADDWVVDVCYCSAMDQCWISRTTTSAPRSVRACPVEDLSDL